jgi:hypothetical protein
MITLRRYCRAAGAWIAAACLLVGLVLFWWRRDERKLVLDSVVEDAKARTMEARLTGLIEITAARNRAAGTKQKLREIMTIESGRERREQLLDLYHEVAG